MEGFTPLRPSAKLADEVTSALAARIASGELMPGDRLPAEKELGVSLGVSRSVVREAISRLKHDGLVETRQGAGAFVAGPQSAKSFRLQPTGADVAPDLAHIFELRCEVEAGAAAFAAERRDAADLVQIEAALTAIQLAMEAGRDGVAEDKALHVAIAAASGNPAFVRFLDFLANQLEEAIRAARLNSLKVAGRPMAVQREHRRVVEAIQAGDSAAARTAMAAHIRAAAQRLGVAR
ncbi:FadR/GntR family transcriptional regulator [Phreatobacter sp.]|uniref:FadR/GntR family transcriptional regulator n=1 Tax=Phreatobacter sp. TaxID=1966341 RepID=UPI003F6E78DE